MTCLSVLHCSNSCILSQLVHGRYQSHVSYLAFIAIIEPTPRNYHFSSIFCREACIPDKNPKFSRPYLVSMKTITNMFCILTNPFTINLNFSPYKVTVYIWRFRFSASHRFCETEAFRCGNINTCKSIEVLASHFCMKAANTKVIWHVATKLRNFPNTSSRPVPQELHTPGMPSFCLIEALLLRYCVFLILLLLSQVFKQFCRLTSNVFWWKAAGRDLFKTICPSSCTNET